MNTFKVLFMLAWRNLWRNHRRTIIMLSAISVGVWAMIFMTALTQGMVNEMIKDGISVLPGHVQVHHPDYRDDPNINNLIPTAGYRVKRSDLRPPDSSSGQLASRCRPSYRASASPAASPCWASTLIESATLSFVDYADVDGRFLEGPMTTASSSAASWPTHWIPRSANASCS